MAAFKILKPAADAPDGQRGGHTPLAQSLDKSLAQPLALCRGPYRQVRAGSVLVPPSSPLLALMLAASLAGCVVAGPDSDNRVDASLLTSSIAQPPGDSRGNSPANSPGNGRPAGDVDAAIAGARAINPYPAVTYPIASNDTVPSAFAGASAQRRPPLTAKASLTTSADAASDARTVRNAVSVADLTDTDGRYEWSNPQTGSSGVISVLTEEREGVRICRRFQTSRQSYDGVVLYRGEACTNGEGEWALVKFTENGAVSESSDNT